MSNITDFLTSIRLQTYASRFIEQGIDSLEDLRYERDLDGLVEDVGLAAADAKTFRSALKAALSGENRHAKGATAPTKEDLAAAVKASLATSRARQGLGEEASASDARERVTGGALRQSGARHDEGPQLSIDETVLGDVNARMGLATGEEIEKILSAHARRDFLELLNLPEVPIDSLGKVEWSGHDAMRTNDVAMRCKLLSLRLDSSRNLHPKAPLAARAVQNALDLMSNKETRREILTEAVRKKVDELRASGNSQLQGGYVTLTGIHYGSGATASRVNEENYVSKDVSNDMPTYDASIHEERTGGDDDDDDARRARTEIKKSSAPKVDVSSIRAKLASKAKRPRFM